MGRSKTATQLLVTLAIATAIASAFGVGPWLGFFCWLALAVALGGRRDEN
jgi:hypothetical protein